MGLMRVLSNPAYGENLRNAGHGQSLCVNLSLPRVTDSARAGQRLAGR